ncbi:MAG: VWA domain-containing protein [Nostocoides sp.]
MTTTVATQHDPSTILLGFARACRAAGLPVTADRERTYLTACAAIGLADAGGVLTAGRATLCSTPQDLDRYDAVYAAWFGGPAPSVTRVARPAPAVASAPLTDRDNDGHDGSDEDEPDPVQALSSATEVLRHRDIAELSAADKRRLGALFGALRPVAPTRPSLRHAASHHGPVDGRRVLREQLRRMGEPGPIRRHERTARPRRVVLLIDVSRSMSPYADALLRLAHRYVVGRGPVEVFTLGTRLTHVTRALRQPDPDRAIVAAGETVPDWSGGTRLGEGLAAFLDRWGRRGLARGAVVVVFSDGWEREGPDLLGEQMRRLSVLAHRVVWVNPHRGKDGYEPVQQGMAAALPYCDDFLAGHSMATFEAVTKVVAHA